MLVAVLSGFILALCLPLIGKFIKGKFSLLVSVLPLILFGYFLSFLPSVSKGIYITKSYQWVSSIGVNLDFNLDGLSLLFTLLITGIGTLVYIYTSYYLKGHVYLDRFYGYLSMFMGSMLGLVLSDNIITLFIFWELTSISSFFLIGFNNDDKESRKSSLIALSVTGLGGLFLLAGMILLGYVAESLTITGLFNASEIIRDHQFYGWILLFLFIAAFTKSAQFPFHFWLPGAMKAPTPVSTYLHSATMVKAGIYLLARFTPVLGGHELWNTTLIIFGGVTMLYAALHAIFRIDLKGILAYSTISALGMLVFLIGLGTDDAMLAMAVFIISHALYKASLFLITGIIDHETGTRDITKLAGLRKVMLPVAVAGFLAAFVSAGVPPTFGFLGKDLIYEATLNAGEWSTIFTIMAVIANIMLLFAGFLAGISPFTNKLPAVYGKVHLPSPLLWVPPLLLALLGLLFGIFPGLLEFSLLYPVVTSLIRDIPDFHLALWHGLNLVLLLSTITIGSGIALYFILKSSEDLLAKVTSLERFSPKSIFLGMAKDFEKFSVFWTRLLQNGYLKNYLLTIVSFLTVLLGYKLFQGVELYFSFEALKELSIYEIVVFVIISVAILFAVFAKSRLVAVASMGVVGYSICLIFLFYSAPDLAMTQFSIDTLTVILFVLVIYNLPRYLKLSNSGDKVRDGILAVIFGALISILALEVLNEPVNREISEFYAESAYKLAHGKNVVNVILVDFRGFDTLVEITVLTIAALGVFSLLRLHIKYVEKNKDEKIQ